MKKILILGKLPPPYMGPAIATKIILDSSLQKKYKLIHIDTKANESLNTIGKFSIRKVFKNYFIYKTMLNALRREKPDLVLLPFSQATTPFIKDSIFVLLSRVTGTKVLLHLRGSNFLNWIKRANPIARWYIKYVIRKCNGIIVLGNNLRYLFKDLFPESGIFVVPNGADFSFPSKVVTENSEINLLYLANLQASKGIEDILKSLVILKNITKMKFQLTVAGQWRNEDFKNKCLGFISENILPVNLLPPQHGDNKLHLLMNAEVFLFTPREPEGHPWVIVEAMAAGLPIISTDQGAIIESVIDGKNGYIIPDKSPEHIAEKLKILLEDKKLRIEFGKNSRLFYEEKFTEDKMVKNLSIAFESVINQG